MFSLEEGFDNEKEFCKHLGKIMDYVLCKGGI